MPRSALKYLALLFPRQARVQLQDLHIIAQLAQQVLADIAYLALAGQKHQNVAAADCLRFSGDFLVGLENRGGQVGIVRIVRRFAVANFDGVSAAAHRDDGRAIEELRYAFDVQSRRGHDHFQIRAARQ